MFAKLYARVTESSLMEESITTRYAFFVMLAIADPHGYVIGTDVAIARRLNMPLEEFLRSAKVLTQPDANSNTDDHEGRRLIQSDGERGYMIVNFLKYRDMRNEDERREYMREYMRSKRAKEKSVNNCKQPLAKLAQEEVTVEVEEESTALTRVRAPRFEKPSREELDLHAAKIGLTADEVDKFVNHYESNGWKVGRNPMKSWPHSLVNWKLNQQAYGTNQQTNRNGAIDRSIGNVGYDPAAPNKAVRVLAEREAAREAAREAERQAAENGVATPLA